MTDADATSIRELVSEMPLTSENQRELAALGIVICALEPLDRTAQARVVRYLMARWIDQKG